VKHVLARTLRRTQTELERKLWYVLRDRRFHKYKFRRQQPIGPYVVDFVCFEQKLILELDGSQHAEPRNRATDASRTAYLGSRGFRVVRFWNLDFRKNKDGVLEVIRLAVENTPSLAPPVSRCDTGGAPSPAGGEGFPVETDNALPAVHSSLYARSAR